MCRYYLPEKSSVVEGATNPSCNIGTKDIEVESLIHFCMKYTLCQERWHVPALKMRSYEAVMWRE
jgi:hypothetical protein